MDFEISKVAETLLSQSNLIGCSLEETWNKWMHPIITEQFTFEEVKKYIDQKTPNIHSMIKDLNLEGDAFGKTLMDIHKESK